ncbi:hypothetical protein [Aquabacterium sp.]|uniref:hypothetical protein n=1 Tax=Aquabacterium sp. TaxID=1872578 RepID=UPI003BB1D3DF
MSGICIGTQLQAPEGYGVLEKDRTYHFLRSSSKSDRVLLVFFVVREPKVVTVKSAKRPTRKITPTPLTLLIGMERSAFEHGLKCGQIIKCEHQSNMPPWLADLDGINLQNLDEFRKNPKRSHSERMEQKVEAIFPLTNNLDSVLDADDPDRVINAHARSCQPKQNETRLRLWFYVFVLFGMNRFALHYPIGRIGRWCRATTTPTCKWGKPHKYKGKGHGHNTSGPMQDLILKGYRRESGIGISMTTIYNKTMMKDFGCRWREMHNGKFSHKELWQPQGKPFPQKGVFVHYVIKEFGSEKVQMNMFGYVRARSKLLPPVGAFTEQIWNLMQKVERDAYAVGDLARGLIEGNHLPPLYVVRVRDTASGMITGIGFSQGGERASAYRMAQFCQAISKVRLFALYGLELSPERWPSKGVSSFDIQDRGAGSTPDAFSRIMTYKPVVSESPPAHAGQSKAVVESSNPRTPSNDEAPGFIASNLRTFELVRRELFRVLKDNDTIYVGDRIPPDLAEHIPRATPLAVWNALDAVGRNDAMQMSFEDAVRAYLTKAKAKLTKEGVVLNKILFKSALLDQIGARKMVSGKQVVDVEVYVLDACLRHIWIDIKGQLIELDLTIKVPVGNEVLLMSLEEIKQFEAFCRERDSFHEDHCAAVTIQTYHDFKAAGGSDWNSGTPVKGRAKRGTRSAKQEAAEILGAIHPTKTRA